MILWEIFHISINSQEHVWKACIFIFDCSFQILFIKNLIIFRIWYRIRLRNRFGVSEWSIGSYTDLGDSLQIFWLKYGFWFSKTRVGGQMNRPRNFRCVKTSRKLPWCFRTLIDFLYQFFEKYYGQENIISFVFLTIFSLMLKRKFENICEWPR